MSPTISGLALLPTAPLSVVTGAIAGVVLTKTEALIILGFGLFSRFNRNTLTAEWLIWQVSLAFALLGFLLCFLEKEITLKTHLETEFELEGKKKSDGLEGGSDTPDANRPAKE
ncbi:hypothetical protein F5Y11DRAFT_343478 [Daldinia sp. FL1419]|nr:hypothetical protein F5Y11DRAFT_343478 [Daldinia sp. FL1419]